MYYAIGASTPYGTDDELLVRADSLEEAVELQERVAELTGDVLTGKNREVSENEAWDTWSGALVGWDEEKERALFQDFYPLF